jgi:hypothetical protein
VSIKRVPLLSVTDRQIPLQFLRSLYTVTPKHADEIKKEEDNLLVSFWRNGDWGRHWAELEVGPWETLDCDFNGLCEITNYIRGDQNVGDWRWPASTSFAYHMFDRIPQ